MRKIIVTEFVSLDGVMEAPERWVFPFHNEQTATVKLAEIRDVDALLLGRKTYRIFADSWPSMTGELADQMNGIRKYVVSSSPADLAWSHSHLLTGDPASSVAALKERPGRDILVAGSATLVRTLIRHNLVDEYRMLLCPTVLGGGKRMFPDEAKAQLVLAESTAFDTGAVLLRYQTAECRGR
jgi:dihydrofolate reductase